MEYEKVVSNNLLAFINRLFTAVLLVVLLIACQQMPENNNAEGFQLEYQAN
jgi:hypothetical protein